MNETVRSRREPSASERSARIPFAYLATTRLPGEPWRVTSDTRPTKKLPPVKSTTYSMTTKRDSIEVTVDDADVTIAVHGQSMRMPKNTARKLVAALLEKLG